MTDMTDEELAARIAELDKICPDLTNCDCEELKNPIKHAIMKTGQCEAYHDGYTATVTDNTEEGEGYLLSIQAGQMPPFYIQKFTSIAEVEEEIRDRSPFPATATWEIVKPEEN